MRVCACVCILLCVYVCVHDVMQRFSLEVAGSLSSYLCVNVCVQMSDSPAGQEWHA
jgi:hypothetical protein